MRNRFTCLSLSVALGWMVLPSSWGAAPPNDSFGSPTFVSGFPTVSAGSNVDATLEAGEPVSEDEYEASVWFRWTAPVSGAVQIDTLGSDFDTVLGIWTNNALANLVRIAENDQYDETDQSAVFFDASNGVTYQIAVYGWHSDRGAIALRITNDVLSRISGRVTGPGGAPALPGIEASAYRRNGDGWNWVASVETAADGTYVIRGLPAGTYRIQFYDESGDHVMESYDGAANLDSGTDIVVPARTTVTGIDAALAEASKISGRVTGPDGTLGLPDIQASAHRWNGSGWSWVASDETAADGTYAIGGLTAGTYRVQFDDYDNGSYQSEAYDDAANLFSGADVVVPATTTVTGIDASLAVAAKIRGTVTGPDGTTRLQGVQVEAYRASGGGWTWGGAGYTASDGTYKIGGLAPGTYRVKFSVWGGEYATEVYNNALDLDSGEDIVVGAGETATGIDAALAASAKISGTVTGPDGAPALSGIQATAYRWDGSEWDWVVADNTAADGTYLIGGLPAGTYRVQFDDYQNGAYRTEVYNNATDLDSGADVVLGEGETVAGIDAALSLADESQISGTVTGPDGTTGLADIRVTVWQPDGSGWGGRSTQTGVDGTYTMGGLTAGTYRVDFCDEDGHYISEVYDNATNIFSGTDVIVGEGEPVTGIDASLAVAFRISGTVTGPDGSMPLSGIWATAYCWDGSQWDPVVEDNTAADGTYAIEMLPAGTYRVQFCDGYGNYRTEAYDDASDLDFGKDIVLDEGATATGIDASLAAWPKMSGVVTGPDGATPLQGITVWVVRWNGARWDWVASDTTDANGAYMIGRLEAGIYRVEFTDGSGTYRGGFYDDAPDLDSGEDLVLGAGETLTGIDASLAHVNSADLAGIQFSGGGGFEIRFTGTPSMDYILQEAHSLTGGWSDVGTSTTALSGVNTLPGSSSASQIFWRVRLLP